VKVPSVAMLEMLNVGAVHTLVLPL